MSLCPECGYHPDYASSISEKATPEEGDLSICINCGALNRFGPGMRLERTEVPDDLTLEQQLKVRLSQDFIRKRGRIPEDVKQ